MTQRLSVYAAHDRNSPAPPVPEGTEASVLHGHLNSSTHTCAKAHTCTQLTIIKINPQNQGRKVPLPTFEKQKSHHVISALKTWRSKQPLLSHNSVISGISPGQRHRVSREVSGHIRVPTFPLCFPE